MRRIGVHVSIAGGVHLSLERAKELGCSTMQIFSHNPRGWAFKDIDKEEASQFIRLSEESDISSFIHSSYLINLASPDDETRRKSIELLSYELRMADLLGIDHVVLHPGKMVGQELNVAVEKTKDALLKVYEKAESRSGILIENTAGQKGDISSSLAMIADVIEGAPSGLVKGICFDTCHGFAAGYDIAQDEGLSRLEQEIKKYLSPLKVELIHLNDAKQGLSSNIDRHEHIGMGAIGIEGFRRFLSVPLFKNIPLVLETPKKEEDDDTRNLDLVRGILNEIG
ncbi:MAG: deoxyribonuclease IV [Thermodesulfovibrionia bacterium]|nr:deoxyribonuclease IV [Thermodesulfovibrionia bacterium]